jgi:hypothetical protein
MIGLHERIDERDVVSPPDNEGVHVEGKGLGAHHAGRDEDVSTSREELRPSDIDW